MSEGEARAIQHCIPAQQLCRDIVGWIETIVSETDIAKCLKHISQQQHISYIFKRFQDKYRGRIDA